MNPELTNTIEVDEISTKAKIVVGIAAIAYLGACAAGGRFAGKMRNKRAIRKLKALYPDHIIVIGD